MSAPNSIKSNISVSQTLIACIPLYALRIFVINLFLAFTTVFPFVILMDGAEISNSMRESYLKALDGMSQAFFFKSTAEMTDANLVGLFFIFVALLSLLIGAIERLTTYLGVGVRFDWRYAAAVMSAIYVLAWLSTLDAPDETTNLFLLMLYMFNIYSIFSYHIINMAFTKLREKTAPSLAKYLL